jgi:putative phosphoesterase
MKLAILSDTHDNIWMLDKVGAQLSQVKVLLHCGDICSPFMIPRLAQTADNRPVHIVWGNNDGDKRLLMVQAEKTRNIQIHGELAELVLDGVKIAVNHYPEIGRALAHSGQYDLVCYGHDHSAHEEKIGDTLLLNPGEVMGLMGRRTMAIYDTRKKELTWVELD